MDDAKQDDSAGVAQEEGKKDVQEETQALVVQEVPFVEQLEKAVGQSVEQFYKDLLVKADETIKAQGRQLQEIQNQQVEFRDEIAIRCFVPLIPLISGSDNYRKAASDAYRAADDFLRVREGGEIT